MKELTTKEAAFIIGCSTRHVRAMIANGQLRATKHNTPAGHYYTVTRRAAIRARDVSQRGGWPRGRPRNGWEAVHDETKELFE